MIDKKKNKTAIKSHANPCKFNAMHEECIKHEWKCINPQQPHDKQSKSMESMGESIKSRKNPWNSCRTHDFWFKTCKFLRGIQKE